MCFRNFLAIFNFVLGDRLDGSDLLALTTDFKEARFYLPSFKERSRFNKLILAETNEKDNQVR